MIRYTILLAKLRYNRLIDIFSGVTCYSLQSHLRSSVPRMGQVEVDEIYIGIDRTGTQYVFPVQAKAGRDWLSVVQVAQDIALCRHKFPGLVCRPVGTQFIDSSTLVLLEFQEVDREVRLLVERHYQLVNPDEISAEELDRYRITSQSEAR